MSRINGKLVRNFVNEILKDDEEYLKENSYQNLDENQRSRINQEMVKMHRIHAKDCYNHAWQSYTLLERINEERAKDLSDSIGNKGLAHEFVSTLYKKLGFKLEV